MNLLMLNAFDDQGGAAIATYRLHSGLRSIGIDSKLLVQKKGTDDYSVIGPRARWKRMAVALRPYLDRLPANFYPARQSSLFSTAWFPDGLASEIAEMNPDIVHLFWLNAGFFRIETLKNIRQPIVWTLHDMWPLTGGCHYDEECGRFQTSCGNCPQLNSEKERDLSRRVWARKKESWREANMVVVATSQWLAQMARSSSLLGARRIEVIPNGIDVDVYKPIDKATARAAYNLPKEKCLILFSAFGAISDKRKGNHFLMEALKGLLNTSLRDRIELVLVGASEPAQIPDFGFKVHYMGQLKDEVSQVLLYSAADVVVAPSVQENLSNTVMESLACGTPVVAFNIGGMPDMIEHRRNGYLAAPFDVGDLAEGMAWVLADEMRHEELSANARKTVVERYSLPIVAERYQQLYKSLLK